MKQHPKEKPEIEPRPQVEREREIPPDFIPEPKQREPIPELQEEEVEES